MNTLIEEWKAILSWPLTLEFLNDEILPQYKAISKSNPERSDIWVMVAEKADELGFAFDSSKLEFVKDDSPYRKLKDDRQNRK